MSQNLTKQVNCMVCGVELAGMVFRSDLLVEHLPELVKEVSYKLKDMLGHECDICGAFVCMNPDCRKKMNFSRWSGWKNAQCKQCGRAFQPNRVVLPKEIGMYLYRLLEADEDFVDLYEQESKDYYESDVERMKRASGEKDLEGDTLKPMHKYKAMGTLKIDKREYKQLCKRLLDTPYWSENEKVKNVLLADLRAVDQAAFMHQVIKDVQGVSPSIKKQAMDVIRAIAEINALWLLEDGRAEELLINIFVGFQQYSQKMYLNYRMDTIAPLVSIGKVMESSKAIPELVEGLMDDEEEIRLRGEVARNLPELVEDPRVQDAILFALEDPHFRFSISEALFHRTKLDHDEGKDYHPLCRKGVEVLIDIMLNSKDVIERSYIAKEIGAVDWDPKVVDGLIHALKDGHRPVDPDYVGYNPPQAPSAGEWAMEWLAKIGEQREIDAIIPIKILGSDNVLPGITKPFELIEQIGEPAFEPLVKALHHENFNVRNKAPRYLARLFDERAFEPLLSVLEEKGSSENEVVLALGSIHDPRAIAPLLNALQNASLVYRGNVKSALENIIFKGENFDQASDLLIEALQSEDKNVRIFAAQTLGKMKEKNAIEHLAQLRKDKDNKVRKAAEKALNEIHKG